MDRRPVALLIGCLVMSACARSTVVGSGAGSGSGTGSCGEVISGCEVKRLPNLTLTGDRKSGALASVDGFDLNGIISFDDALRRAGKEDGVHPDAESVQVILGSADAGKLHWGSGTRLFYAIDWAGTCVIPIGPPPGYSGPSCFVQTWGTVVDAQTGEFIVSGTG